MLALLGIVFADELATRPGGAAVKMVLASDRQGAAAYPVAVDGHGAHMPADAPGSLADPVDPHAAHRTHKAAPPPMATSAPTPAAQAPDPPRDHAADALFDPKAMARSREILRRENGSFTGSTIRFEVAEVQMRKGRDGYRWVAEAAFGGDINRLLIKSEGGGGFSQSTEHAEGQLLFSRAVAPYWNAHVGVRYDIAPNPSRTYMVIGVEGLAPFWFHMTGQAFVSDKGDARARVEASYDQRLTQRIFVTPRVELNVSAQDMKAIDVGQGLTDAEIGLRLHYEIKREFAPYLGVSWARKIGKTARIARRHGHQVRETHFVLGARLWF